MLPDMTAPKAEQEKVLAASVITALLSAGFTLAAQCTLAASSSSQAPPEIAFTLVRNVKGHSRHIPASSPHASCGVPQASAQNLIDAHLPLGLGLE